MYRLEWNFAEGVLTFLVNGRVDTANAAHVDEEMAAIMDSLSEKPERVVMDCKELQFISSTGLRVLLKYRKMFDDLRVVNVRREVYDVFELTGFSRIMTVQRALRKVNLEQCSLMAKGGNGAVYRVNEEEIVKVQFLAGTEEMMQNEMRRSKAAFVLGVPTAISYDIVDCGEGCHGAVYEALNSDTLGRFVHAHPECLPTCATKYAELLRTLHSCDASGTEFVSIKEGYRRMYESATDIYSAEELTMLNGLLDMIPDRTTLVHADAHTNNILMGANGELMFIDMADTDLGHPIFDYAGIALAMIITMNSDRCVGICGMEKEEIQRFLSIAFARLLRLTDKEEVKRLFPRLVSLAMIKQSMTVCIDKPSVNAVRPMLLSILRERLFGNIEQVKRDVMWFLETSLLGK